MSNWSSLEEYCESQHFERELMEWARIAWRVGAVEAEIYNCIDGRDSGEVLGQGIGDLFGSLLFSPNGNRPTPSTYEIFACAFRGNLGEEGKAEFDQLMSSVEKAMDKIRENYEKEGEELIHNNSDCHHWPSEAGICQKVPEINLTTGGQQ
jgi:hypothetical protein